MHLASSSGGRIWRAGCTPIAAVADTGGYRFIGPPRRSSRLQRSLVRHGFAVDSATCRAARGAASSGAHRLGLIEPDRDHSPERISSETTEKSLKAFGVASRRSGPSSTRTVQPPKRRRWGGRLRSTRLLLWRPRLHGSGQ